MIRLTVLTPLLDMLTTGGDLIPKARVRVRHIAFASVLVVVFSSNAAESDFMAETGFVGANQTHDNVQPALVLNHIIALQGVFPSRTGAADGTFLGEVSRFAGNFAPSGWAFADGQLLSIAQNAALFSLLGTTYGGDGRTTFALPDLRGRAAIHEGLGSGLTNRRLGWQGGVEEVTLTTAQMPTHNHTLPSNATTFDTGDGQDHMNVQPSLGINHNIATVGIFPARGDGEGRGNTETFLGEVRMFAGTFAPGGRVDLDGQLLSIAQNSALFSLLGTTYGGDGRTTFALPDLRGRTSIHAGRGPGLTDRSLGWKGGAEDVTLSQAQMPTHNHGLAPAINATDQTGNMGSGQSHTEMQPSLALNYIIALNGTFPSRGRGRLSEDFIGEISLFAGNFAPRGWALSDGQLLPIAQNSALFSLLGTTYGGDGRTTFALPDLRGRAAIHAGSGPGLSFRQLGWQGGAEKISLTTDQLPSHLHVVPEPAQGDFDGDGNVDFTDFSTLAFNFTGTLEPGTGGFLPEEGDIDGDGDVDFTDFSTFAFNFTGTIIASASDTAPDGDVHLEINVDSGAMTLEPNNADLAGYSIRSPDSQLVPDADGTAAPFMFYLLNAPQEVTAGSVGSTTTLSADLALDISFAGDSDQAANVVFQYTRAGDVTPVDGVVHVIPEPTTMMLLAASGFLVLPRRRRCA